MCNMLGKRKRVRTDGGEGPNAQEWERPQSFLNEMSDDLIFMCTEFEDAQDFSRPPPPEAVTCVTPVPYVQVFGVTWEGMSVLLKVHGFQPYMYIECPLDLAEEYYGLFMEELNKAILLDLPLMSYNKSNYLRYDNCVLDVSPTDGKSIMGWHPEGDITFLRITLAHHKLVSVTKRLLEQGKVVGNDLACSGTMFQTYESKVGYHLRWMINSDVTGAGWIRVPATCYRQAIGSGNEGWNAERKSRCSIEAICNTDDIESLGTTGEWEKIAPARILSFDIECMTCKGRFPHPHTDAVIQIANVVKCFGNPKPIINNVFVLGGCSAIPGAEVLWYPDEGDMLREWTRFVHQCDPDFFTGYNINNFDFWYLLERMIHLEVVDMFPMGRILNCKTRHRETRFNSKAYGLRINREVTHPGVVTLDMMQILQRDYKLRSYSLNSVSAHFLDQQKEDVPYSIIGELQNGSNEDRKRIAVYCLKDALLPLNLMDKLMIFVNYMEMARVTGIPPGYIISRGQQIKVLSQILRKARAKGGIMVPTMMNNNDSGPNGGGVGYKGATVIDPIRGFYQLPIATLDFASLYPSIMMAHNLCYSSLLRLDQLHLLEPDQYTKTPKGDHFAKAAVIKGILPEILEELLAARKIAKRQMAIETDPQRKSVQNGRQLALKVSANSVYGFTGVTVGATLPCIPIGRSVTGFGREMIELTSTLVEKHYCKANGYPHDALVIYGDTDSVMVRFGVETVAESIELGLEAAAYVTKEAFIKPISLEFEKVYHPYLLLKKKRYAGLYYTKPDKWDKMDCKGLVTVRRDNCRMVKNVITKCLDLLLIDQNVPAAIAHAKQVISDLLQNKIDISQLIVSKNYSKEDYVNPQAHVTLAKRMMKRDPGSAPRVGDRIPYVFIRGMKNSKAYQNTEDPVYAMKNKLPIGVEYYLTNHLTNPLLDIFLPVDPNAKNLLFNGAHTKTIVRASNSNVTGGLSAFVVKMPRCMGCNCILPSNLKSPVCDACKPNESAIYMRQLEKVNTHEMRSNRFWDQCHQCQGSYHRKVLCQNNDCIIFFARTAAVISLEDERSELARFDDITDIEDLF